MTHIGYLLKTYPRSLFFCLRYLPFRQALHIPIILGKIKIGKLKKNQIILLGKHKHGSIVLGMSGTEGRGNKPFYISIHNDGKLILAPKTTMAAGTVVVINGSTLDIGSNFFCNENCNIFCTRNIKIGDNGLWGWNVELNTTDGHQIIYNGEERPQSGEIIIGKHVWLCAESHICKNVKIANDCVVAQRSLVNKQHLNNNTLIGGIPAKNIKSDIIWKT